MIHKIGIRSIATEGHEQGKKFRIVSLLLSYTAVDVNATNKQQQTTLDLTDKLLHGDSTLEIKEALTEYGAKYARHVGKVDEAMELERTVSHNKYKMKNLTDKFWYC